MLWCRSGRAAMAVCVPPVLTVPVAVHALNQTLSF